MFIEHKHSVIRLRSEDRTLRRTQMERSVRSSERRKARGKLSAINISLLRSEDLLDSPTRGWLIYLRRKLTFGEPALTQLCVES